jgi:hypothetical protein
VSTRQQLDEAIDACLKALTTSAEDAANASSTAAARDNAEIAERLAHAVSTLVAARPHF